MIYGNEKIWELLESGAVRNTSVECIGPCSLDLRVGGSFATIAEDDKITLGKKIEYIDHDVDDYFVIMPQEFALATTREYFKLPQDVGCVIKGRSSIGRAGLCIQNAGYVDAGFEGEITLELYNQADVAIAIPVGYRIAQAVFFPVEGCTRGYLGKYSAQTGATGSRAHMDAEAQHG